MNGIDWGAFNAGLDAYQAQREEEAHEARERSYVVAARPDAVPQEATFAELRPGDYMTNEGPKGRWVKVLKLVGPSCYAKSKQTRVKDGEVAVLFEIAEAVTVSGELHWWVERPLETPVLIDLSVRRTLDARL